MYKKILAPALALITASVVFATPFTETSPTANGLVPSGITKVGGIVFDARGLNGASLTAQRAASSLYSGFAGTNPQVIGTQSGLTGGLLGLLGGGFSELAIRVTLEDGDTGPGDFDFNQNTLAINGITIGNFSSVATQRTDATGVTALSSSTGFRNGILDTGWFHVTNAVTLASLYTSILGTNSAVYSLTDVDPFDNFYDFTRGVDGGLINTEVPPVVVPTPDTGATFGLLALSGLGLLLARRRRNV